VNLLVTPEAVVQRDSRVRSGSRRALRPAQARLRRAGYWPMVSYELGRLPMLRLGSPECWRSRPDHRPYERPGRRRRVRR
jgi:hypothetical protein